MTVLLERLAVAALGVYAGANLTEGLVLVTWWRTLSPAAFFAWYAANDRRLLGFFGPLTTAVLATVVAAALASAIAGDPGRWLAALAAASTFTAAATFPVYFRDANAGFAAGTVEDLAAELRRWAVWHWARTALGLAALVAALLATG
jgi:hypothetical protein